MTPSELFKAILSAIAFVCFIAFMSARAEANQTQWEREANIEWKQRHGEWQPNLGERELKYLQKQTALLEQQRHENSKSTLPH